MVLVFIIPIILLVMTVPAGIVTFLLNKKIQHLKPWLRYLLLFGVFSTIEFVLFVGVFWLYIANVGFSRGGPP
ncbi:MAG: hypothetical protein GY827_09835 [Cytophagales bacterium]|nr:hypothetical protein [Cytophagales bacterium]